MQIEKGTKGLSLALLALESLKTWESALHTIRPRCAARMRGWGLARLGCE